MDEPSESPGQGVVCSLCGDVNDGTLFCRACGRARPVDEALRCERCGTPDDGSRFCRTCGAPGGRLFAGAEPPPAGDGRRRLVIALAAGALAVAAAVAIVIALTGSKSHPHSAPATRPVTTAGQGKPATTTAAAALAVLRTIAIAPLHARDPQNRCFGPAPRAGSPHVTLRLGGIYRENVAGKPLRAAILLCGKGGDPAFATGIYRFRRTALGKGTRLGKLTVRFGIDESGGQVQAGAKVGLTVVYYGKTVCKSAFASWRKPRTLVCDLSHIARPADASRLQISQAVQGAKAPDVWAGLMSPRVALLGRSS
jgi:hypothetical protein